jgi:hypothetical protein
VNLLWKINLRKVRNVEVMDHLFILIWEYYEKNFDWSYKLMPIHKILRYVIDNFEN